MVSLHVVAMKTRVTLVDVSVCGLAAGSEHDVLDSSVRRWSAVYSSLMAVVVAPLAEPARADCTAKRSRSGVRKQVLMEPNSDLQPNPQKLQTYRLRWASSCIHTCRLKFHERPNAPLKIERRCVFSPEWTDWWVVSLDKKGNVLLNLRQRWDVSDIVL